MNELILIFAQRYNRLDKRGKLPTWITQFMAPSHLNLSVESAVALARTFLKEIAQPIDRVRHYSKVIKVWSQE